MEVEGVIAHAPRDGALLRRRRLIRLALDAQIHDVVAADGAGVDLNVPRPKRDGIPFFDFKPFGNARWDGGCGCR